jgi:spectinomycin phosphotransferase
MRDRPTHLGDEPLQSALGDGFGVRAAGLAFLPIGHDSSAWVFRVDAETGDPYFLKVRRGAVNEAGLLVPRLLHEQGIRQIVAPLPAADGTLWSTMDSHALILYPYLEGTAGMQTGLTAEQWVVYGEVLRAVHEVVVPDDLAAVLRREDFLPPGLAVIREVDAFLAAAPELDDAGRFVATYWMEQRDVIHAVAHGADALSRRVAAANLPFVLCHADIHTNNVLVDDTGGIWIVDWDEAMLAPRERDLMFVLGGGISRELVTPENEDFFARGYGEVAVDPDALAYYRYAWAVNDVASYAQDVLMRPDLGPGDRERNVEILQSLFRPGEIFDLALRSHVV